MPGDVGFLAPGVSRQSSIFNLYFEPAEQHLAGSHFVHDGIQPVDEQQFIIGRLALDRNLFTRLDPFRFGDHGGHGQRCLFEGLRERSAVTPHAHVGLVREVFPSNLHSLGQAAPHQTASSSAMTSSSLTSVQ